MINDANAIDLEDLDDLEQDPIDEPGYQEPEPDVEEPVRSEPDDDFDLTKELLALQGVSDMN